MDRRLRQRTGILEQGCIRVGEYFGMERLEAVKGYLNVLGAKHAIAPVSEKLPSSFRRLCPNRFYRDC